MHVGKKKMEPVEHEDKDVRIWGGAKGYMKAKLGKSRLDYAPMLQFTKQQVDTNLHLKRAGDGERRSRD